MHNPFDYEHTFEWCNLARLSDFWAGVIAGSLFVGGLAVFWLIA